MKTKLALVLNVCFVVRSLTSTFVGAGGCLDLFGIEDRSPHGDWDPVYFSRDILGDLKLLCNLQKFFCLLVCGNSNELNLVGMLANHLQGAFSNGTGGT